MELHKYTPEQLKGIQKANLEMAIIFYDFCKENNLVAYMCGGGCIGSIRHKGFIPWDDDIDFFMPRKDYEIFLERWNDYEKGKDLHLSCSDKNYVDRNLFATLRNKNTTYIKPYQADLDIVHGVQLDIIPLDGYPDSATSRKFQVIWALIYSLFRAQTVPEKHGGLMAKGSKILLGIVKSKKARYRIWNFAMKKMTKYSIDDCRGITELCSGPHYMKNWYSKAWFESYIEADFEGVKLPIPVGYDKYLKKAFGDYMQLPPKEQRVAHHDCVYLDLDKPYYEYKGKYYMVEDKEN